MRISAIQNQIQPKAITRRVSSKNETIPRPQEQPVAPAFKGGKGGLLGFGGGLIAGLIIFAGGAITGGLAVPAIVGSLGVLGSGAGGAYVGDKIEEKLTGGKD